MGEGEHVCCDAYLGYARDCPECGRACLCAKCFAEFGREHEMTPEQSAACDLADAANTPEQYESAHVAMRAAFPEIAAAYSDEEQP